MLANYKLLKILKNTQINQIKILIKNNTVKNLPKDYAFKIKNIQFLSKLM